MYTINSNINKYQMSNPSSLHLSLDQYIQIHPNNRGKEEKSTVYNTRKLICDYINSIIDLMVPPKAHKILIRSGIINKTHQQFSSKSLPNKEELMSKPER